MNIEPFASTPEPARLAAPLWPARGVLVLALALLAATFFLISPPSRHETYPGAIPWREGSLLHRLTDLMSLDGRLATVRGVEIKDLVFHLAPAIGFILVALCGRGARPESALAAGPVSARALAAGLVRLGPVSYARLLLAAWVIVALLSSLWSGDPAIARGQALLYALAVAWASVLASSLSPRQLPALLWGFVLVSCLGAALCVWYYYERNPFHRPGFPLGNPSVLAAAILPGTLVALVILGGALGHLLRDRRRPAVLAGAGALASLVPLVWCLVLTYSRGALVGLAGGLAAIALSLAGRWLRWLLAALFAVGALLGAMWWFSASHLDLTMARGATMRFRLYAWRYAAELWDATSNTQLVGLGAGSYPRLAGAFAVRDRALDPAAFMAEIVEHAHNELFEVLSEIGLIGGLTYVGGFIATLFAAALALRRRSASGGRWPLIALVSGFVAMLVESMLGSALRLPGTAAIFYTVLGGLWVAGHDSPVASSDAGPAATVPRSKLGGLGHGFRILLCLAAGVGCGWIAFHNWSGVQYERAANAASRAGEFEHALELAAQAEPRLLDPVRVMDARRLALRCRFGLAREAFTEWVRHPATQPADAADNLRTRALATIEQTHVEALRLGVGVPSLEKTDAIAARCAEWLALMNREKDPRLALEWAERAEKLWRRQRERAPFDVETLLALLRYRAPLEGYVVLLRDALRFLDTLSFDETYQYWHASLASLARQPAFETTLAQFRDAAGPITPKTDLDAIIASMAPETYRLVAAWHALRGEFDQSATFAERAVQLYAPLRTRFPTSYSEALAEQARYLFRASTDDAARCVELLRQALAALPVIQAQKYAEMARPFRLRLWMLLSALDQSREAEATLREALAFVDDSTAMQRQANGIMEEALAAGVPEERIERARQAWRAATTTAPASEDAGT